ncbi:hypothetical protein ElyMa_006856100 [Elysia marginata]|uniref:Uncharacterized protein n=1 Tax=Elysia marginata TaxID=1093978 RepID=A0AAV4J8U9_9GAST|nr:hypothetical protein ElyMa_006856100 [Elysia marginata]
MMYFREGWPGLSPFRGKDGNILSKFFFRQLQDSISCETGCLFYETRLLSSSWEFTSVSHCTSEALKLTSSGPSSETSVCESALSSSKTVCAGLPQSRRSWRTPYNCRNPCHS